MCVCVRSLSLSLSLSLYVGVSVCECVRERVRVFVRMCVCLLVCMRAQSGYPVAKLVVKHSQSPARSTELLRFVTSDDNSGGHILHSNDHVELGFANDFLEARDSNNIQQFLYLRVCVNQVVSP